MILRAALVYAELGMPVFGVLADCRTPYKRKGWFERGCHDATTDVADLERRWREAHPEAQVAVATGDRAGAFVLDIDAKGEVDGFKSLAQLEAQFSPLPPTVTASTPSGGEHRWFRKAPDVGPVNAVGLRLHHEDGSRTVYAGLDIRTNGGSVCVPPSRKPHGTYNWIRAPWDHDLADPPDWLVKLIGLSPSPSPKTPLKLSSCDRMARYVAAAVNGECIELARMGQGSGRNLRLFQASANLGSLVGAGLLPVQAALEALEHAADDCGLWKEDGPNAVRATIKSGLNRGLANPREVAL